MTLSHQHTRTTQREANLKLCSPSFHSNSCSCSKIARREWRGSSITVVVMVIPMGTTTIMPHLYAWWSPWAFRFLRKAPGGRMLAWMLGQQKGLKCKLLGLWMVPQSWDLIRMVWELRRRSWMSAMAQWMPLVFIDIIWSQKLPTCHLAWRVLCLATFPTSEPRKKENFAASPNLRACIPSGLACWPETDALSTLCSRTSWVACLMGWRARARGLWRTSSEDLGIMELALQGLLVAAAVAAAQLAAAAVAPPRKQAAAAAAAQPVAAAQLAAAAVAPPRKQAAAAAVVVAAVQPVAVAQPAAAAVAPPRKQAVAAAVVVAAGQPVAVDVAQATLARARCSARWVWPRRRVLAQWSACRSAICTAIPSPLMRSRTALLLLPVLMLASAWVVPVVLCCSVSWWKPMDSQILEISQQSTRVTRIPGCQGSLGGQCMHFLILCAQHDLSRTVAATTCSWASALKYMFHWPPLWN